MSELPKHYEPADVEAKWYAKWLEEKAFSAKPDAEKEPWTIAIPPPNVTGILHMGHALNNTIQDVLIRWKRMQGKNALWVPGTDHAGIATQNVVERKLAKEGKSRHDLSREEFLKEVWAWKEDYGSTIVSQLKKLGSSCDWDRERFTMDEGLSKAVLEVFCRLYDKKLIYRGNRIINWCPRCATALSDEESEHIETEGALYYIRYAVKDGKRKITVATTRPETMLGDVAVAVNPRDKRYSDLIGETLVLPILGREIPVVADEFVDPSFGTGCVKVTPAHDPNDFEIGLRHKLEPINVMDPDGTMNEQAGPYAGLDRFECRKQLIEDLRQGGLVEKIEKHMHAVGHCYRCTTVVEPRLSPQWFVDMKPLAQPAIEAVRDGRIQFVPERWTKVYLEWMENIRDWCISRQIWWGHRIPVFYCDACGHEWAAKEIPGSCPVCGVKDIRQDEDVLDTWFSSWLWPFSVFDWPAQTEDLNYFYPTQTVVTASEIIFFWVARMIMAGMEFMGDIPFDTVYIHGTVRDSQGRKMSKSLGNSIDPLEIIEKYSADALRFSLMMLTATGQDVYISDEKFEVGRNFCTKIWNAARFMQMNAVLDTPVDPAKTDFSRMTLSPDDQHILSKLSEAVRSTEDNLDRYRFNDAALAIYDFMWHHYCDWYVEYSKGVFRGDDLQRRQDVGQVMHYVFSRALCLLHPFVPFLTEELWHGMGYNIAGDSIQTAPWPNALSYEQLSLWGVESRLVEYVDAKHDLIRVGRTLRSDYNLTPKQQAKFIIRPAQERTGKLLREDVASVSTLLGAESVEINRDFTPAGAMPSGISQLGTVYMSIEGLIDADAEIKRLKKQLGTVENGIGGITKKLSNENFISKAPADVVAGEEKRKGELLGKREKLRKLIEMLSA
ncbi:MAG: valyl-tRNA synthetase [Verrucomicrobiota bacterium]|jgi:valyl-tRNA synthetase|nr:valyl-tRNA synthetase [Verrucomicrobiota bacterium]MDK2963708.1 valyl-tRNA synthetase [Verrucomicrobiota bacterium]